MYIYIWAATGPTSICGEVGRTKLFAEQCRAEHRIAIDANIKIMVYMDKGHPGAPRDVSHGGAAARYEGIARDIPKVSSDFAKHSG